ncbi:MAG: hypothetical protein AB4038_07735 [Prochloraceae cyanobacterium]
MHYPVILYPEEIEDFCRQYLLLEEEQGIEKREQNITVPPRSLPVDADETKPIGQKKLINEEDSSKTKTQSKAESNRQKKLTKRNPVKLLSRASSRLLLAVWLFWLIEADCKVLSRLPKADVGRRNLMTPQLMPTSCTK